MASNSTLENLLPPSLRFKHLWPIADRLQEIQREQQLQQQTSNAKTAPRNDDELKQYLLTEYNIVVPDTQVCPNHTTPFRAFSDAYFARFNVTVWEGSRGFAGKSYLLALLGHIEADTLGAEVTILGGSGEQSTRVIEYLQKWSSGEENIQRRTRYRSGGLVTALMASSKSARGPHPQRLRMDECLARGSLVATPQGWRDIASLCLNDSVYSWHEGQLITTAVRRVWSRGWRETRWCGIGSTGFHATPEHPVLTAGGWAKAEEATDIQAVPFLWEAYSSRQAWQQSALYGLLPSLGEYGSYADLFVREQKGGRVPCLSCLPLRRESSAVAELRGLQQEAHKSVSSLSALSSTLDEQSRYGALCGCTSEGERCCITQFGRNADGRAFNSIRIRIQAASADQSLDCRFSSRRTDYRGSRCLLARQTISEAARRTQAEGFDCDGLQRLILSHGSNASLVAKPFTVEQGSVHEVFDITTDTGTFVAWPGVVVHNCDEMELAILDAAMGQPMGTEKVAKQTVMSSTHHYADGTFTEIKKRADEKGWPVQEWCLDGDSAILTPSGEMRIKDLRPGGLVFSHQCGEIKPTRITSAWCSGVRQTIIITTDANSLKCTPEHRILTPNGWKQASDLQIGDKVFSVSQEQTEIRRRSLPQVPQRQEVSRLWQDNHQRSNPLQWLLRQATRTVGSATSGQIGLSVMQGAQAGHITSMPDLLSQGIKSTQYQASGNNGTGSSTNSILWQFTATTKYGRDCIRGSLTKAINQLSQTTVIRTLRGRFRAARLWLSGGGKWPLLAFQRGADRTRQVQGTSGSNGRLETFGALDGSAPSLGLSTVRGVEYGNVVYVYDITVSEGESFIANGIVVHNCYKETSGPDGWLTQEEIESKRGEVTASMWAAEYDLQEPSPEGRAILPEAVDACFRDEFNGKLSAQELLGPMGYELIIEEPVKGATYATGGDWAKKKDHTVIDTLRTDVRPMRRVAWSRYQRMSWPMMIAKFDARVAKYPGPACHDATGLGDVVDDYQEADARGVVLSGQTRADVFTKYIAAIEDRAIVSAKIKYCEGEHRYCTNEDLAAGTKGHPPDSFVAGAMAYRAASTKEMQFF